MFEKEYAQLHKVGTVIEPTGWMKEEFTYLSDLEESDKEEEEEETETSETETEASETGTDTDTETETETEPPSKLKFKHKPKTLKYKIILQEETDYICEKKILE